MSDLMSKNPIVDYMYTADPAPMVYGDTLYLYTTHDEDELVNNFTPCMTGDAFPPRI